MSNCQACGVELQSATALYCVLCTASGTEVAEVLHGKRRWAMEQANVFDWLAKLPAGSVDCCVTSPPYWMLRSYLPKGHPLKPLELGSEATPAKYVSSMVRVFGLAKRLLAAHGTCWLNVGDSYASGGGQAGNANKGNLNVKAGDRRGLGVPEGNLCLIPQRLAIALQDDGWIVRSVIVWHKPAAMPASLAGWAWRRCRVKVGGRTRGTNHARSREGSNPSPAHPNNGIVATECQWQDCPGCKKCSHTDGFVLRKGSWRPTSSWEPILLLAKQPGYFSDGEPVKTPAAAATLSRNEYTRVLDDPDEQFAVAHDHETLTTTANARDVQTWAAEPLKEKHYAAFPSALVRFCLQAGTSAKGYCPTCGGPWVRVIESLFRPHQASNDHAKYPVGGDGRFGNQAANRHRDGHQPGTNETSTIGWRPSCKCTPAEPRPGLVLDPFAGSGRTALTANRLGLRFIGCDLNESYCEIARRLLTEDAPLFA